jgi:hypothetical protein
MINVIIFIFFDKIYLTNVIVIHNEIKNILISNIIKGNIIYIFIMNIFNNLLI